LAKIITTAPYRPVEDGGGATMARTTQPVVDDRPEKVLGIGRKLRLIHTMLQERDGWPRQLDR
jgi:hypothetical protein